MSKRKKKYIFKAFSLILKNQEKKQYCFKVYTQYVNLLHRVKLSSSGILAPVWCLTQYFRISHNLALCESRNVSVNSVVLQLIINHVARNVGVSRSISVFTLNYCILRGIFIHITYFSTTFIICLTLPISPMQHIASVFKFI